MIEPVKRDHAASMAHIVALLGDDDVRQIGLRVASGKVIAEVLDFGGPIEAFEVDADADGAIAAALTGLAEAIDARAAQRGQLGAVVVTRVSIGDIVLSHERGLVTTAVVTRPAIVTTVLENGSVDLCSFGSCGGPRLAVPHSTTPKHNTFSLREELTAAQSEGAHRPKWPARRFSPPGLIAMRNIDLGVWEVLLVGDDGLPGSYTTSEEATAAAWAFIDRVARVHAEDAGSAATDERDALRQRLAEVEQERDDARRSLCIQRAAVFLDEPDCPVTEQEARQFAPVIAQRLYGEPVAAALFPATPQEDGDAE